MIGRRDPSPPAFDATNVYSYELVPGSFHAQLAQAASRLFRDEDFEFLYASGIGRPSVPPSQLALLMLLQHEAGVSDEETIARSGCDLRWSRVLGSEPGVELCAKSTLQLFRARLLEHEEGRLLFEKSIEEAKRSGLLKRGPLRIALDTKPMLGRGATEDAYNLLSTGIRKLCRVLARAAAVPLEEWMGEEGLERYLEPSIKGSAEIDWSDEGEKNALFSKMVKDACQLLKLAQEGREGWRRDSWSEEGEQAIQEAVTLLGKLLIQDVDPTAKDPTAKDPTAKDPTAKLAAEDVVPKPTTGESQAEQRAPYRVKEGTAADRMPSATDPDQRHGRKSKSHRFKGHKTAIAVEVESQIITDIDILFGNDPDAANALEMAKRTEEATGEKVEQVVGDCAYGSGETRQAFAEAGIELVARAPKEGNRGTFPKSRFVLDLVNNFARCPGGQTSQRVTYNVKDGSRVFHFGEVCQGCALRGECTPSAQGRSLHIHPQEALLQQGRDYQQTPEGKQALLERQGVEHRLARLAQLGIRQARYVGHRKSRLQLFMVAAIANFRRTWNWESAQKREQAQVRAVEMRARQRMSVEQGWIWRCYRAMRGPKQLPQPLQLAA